MAAPKRKTDEILEELNSIVLAPDRDLRKLDAIEREATRLENFGFTVDAKKIFGMAASLRGDYRGVKANFDAALIAFGYDYDMQAAYATSLLNVHHFTEALALINKLYEKNPYDAHLIGAGIKAGLSSFDRPALKKYIEAGLNLKISQSEEYVNLLNIQDEMLSGIPDTVSLDQLHVFSDVVSSICDELYSAGFHALSVGQSYIDGYCLIRYMVLGGVEHTIAAESCMHEYLASLPYSDFDKYFITACLQYEREPD